MSEDIDRNCTAYGAPVSVQDDLLARFGPALRRFFSRRVAAEDVDDLVQEVFLRLHVARDRILPDSAERYMFTVARNVLVDRHRHQQARGGYPVTLPTEWIEPVDPLSPERLVIGKEEYARALHAVLSLPPRARMAFQLHRFEHMTYQTIATHMGISRESVKELIHRALVHLATRMEEEA